MQALSQEAFVSCVIYGIAAAALMPLFLNMISSDLLNTTADGHSHYFVFFGFCLVAGVSSRRFINGVSDRVLADLKKVEAQIQQSQAAIVRIENEVQPVMQCVEELDDGDDALLAANTAIKPGKKQLGDDEYAVLAALRSPKYSYRTAGGIASDAGLANTLALSVLNRLNKQGLIAKREKGARHQYYLLDAGRDALDTFQNYYMEEIPLALRNLIKQGIASLALGQEATLEQLVGCDWTNLDSRVRKYIGRVFSYLVLKGDYPELEQLAELNPEKHKLYRKRSL